MNLTYTFTGPPQHVHKVNFKTRVVILGDMPATAIVSTRPAITDPAVIGADYIVPDSADVIALADSQPGPTPYLLILDGNGLPTNTNQLRLIPAQYKYNGLSSYTNTTEGKLVGSSETEPRMTKAFNIPYREAKRNQFEYSLDLGDIDTTNIEIVTVHIPDPDMGNYSIQKIDTSNNVTLHNPVEFIKVPLNGFFDIPVSYLMNLGQRQSALFNKGVNPVDTIYIKI